MGIFLHLLPLTLVGGAAAFSPAISPLMASHRCVWLPNSPLPRRPDSLGAPYLRCLAGAPAKSRQLGLCACLQCRIHRVGL